MRIQFVLLLLCTLSICSADEKALCVFCEIAVGKREAVVVYRDNTVVAFMDRAPQNPGHVLVIPVRHADGILDVPDSTLSQIAKVAQLIAKAIKATDLKAEGIRLGSNTGTAAGQSVHHLHLHVIPKFIGEPAYAGEKQPISPAAELNAAAEKIRGALKEVQRDAGGLETNRR